MFSCNTIYFGGLHYTSFQESFRTSSGRKGGRGESGKMFFVAGGKSGGGSGGERRSIYQKFKEVDVLDKKKTVTALSAGEDRAMFLGLGMILSSVMMYFVLCITILRSYADSVWTEESVCIVLNSTIAADVNCSYSCGSDCWRASKYPCLQIYVSVNSTGRVSLLSHNEESQEANSEVHSLDTLPALIAPPDKAFHAVGWSLLRSSYVKCCIRFSRQCFYVPKCQKDSSAMHAMTVNISERLKVHQQVHCYYDPGEQQGNVLLSRLYGRSTVFHSLFWPSCMLMGGALIILMVKLTQYLSILSEEIGKINR